MPKPKAPNREPSVDETLNLIIPPHIRSIPPYIAGKPIEEVEQELGIDDVAKLASNENPLGTSPRAIQAVAKAMSGLHRYPDAGGHALIQHIAKRLGIEPGNVVLGNGSDEIIGMLTRVLLRPGDEAVVPRPGFLMYDISVRIIGATPVAALLKHRHTDFKVILDRVTPKTRLIFVNNPHNPTGSIVTKAAFEDFLGNIPRNIAVIVDEAYIEFVRDINCLNSLEHIDTNPCVVVLRTFSKAYGLAGLRVGYGVMPPALADLVNRIREPFNVNAIAQAAACAALDDDAFLKKTVDHVHRELEFFYRELKKMGFSYFPTQANFFLVDVKRDAQKVFQDLLEQGVIVRAMASYGYPKFIRVSIGQHEENVKFLNALGKVVDKKA